MQLLIFGFGFTGHALARRLLARGWDVSATVRRPEDRAPVQAQGVRPVDPADSQALAEAAGRAQAILIAAPPGERGCPGLAALAPALTAGDACPGWIGYLSSTGVYGDRQGHWVLETSALNAQSVEGARRVGAERDWLRAGRDMDIAVTLFRLPGIYGPGRSPFDRLREGTAHRLDKPGHVFSRIHVEDLAAGLHASMLRPRPGGIYNLADDEPAPAAEVTAYAAALLGMAPPPLVAFDEAAASLAQRRFYGECKRVSNALAKAELGWRSLYPSYREGLRAVLDTEASRN